LGVVKISDAADLYLGELTRAGRKTKTITAYRATLYRLADMYPYHDVRDLDAEDVRRFLDTFQTNRKTGEPNSGTTIGQRIGHVDGFLVWLFQEGKVPRVASERIRRPKKADPLDNDNVVTISSEDARLLLLTAAGMGWAERIALNLALFTGARRQALVQIRRRDYDPFGRTLTFREKGGRTIVKPVANDLGEVLDAAIFAGLYDDDDAYLIPSLAQQRRAGTRDPRIVSRLVARVADRAGVKTHVHALRAAFAVAYLEEMGADHLPTLQDLMGHRRPDTTQLYLRRLNRRRNMEEVRGFTFGLNSGKASTPVFEAKPVTEKEGFEPSFDANPHGNRVGVHRDAPGDRDGALG